MSELKRALLSALEETYATDAVPLATTAVEAFDIQPEPLAGQEQTKRIAGGAVGARRVYRVGEHQTLRASVPLSGSGTAGEAAIWSSLARMCGLSETVTADTSVAYAPVSTGHESGTVYFHQDGTRHRLLGVRGTASINIPSKDEPSLQFELMGLYTAPAAAALPTINFAGPDAIVPSSASVTTCTLFGQEVIMDSLVANWGHSVNPRHRVNSEAITIDDTVSTATIVIEAPALGDYNWWLLPQARTKGVLALTHGTAAGNIISVAAPAVQITKVSRRFDQMRELLELTCQLHPDEGNDSLSLTLT
jgi:hypothetical protein